MVTSAGERGKCMMTSWAERTSFTLFRGTPLGVPPVPEPEDAAAWMERERELEAEMAALLADEERLVYA